MQLDTSNAVGRMAAGIAMQFAQFEREIIGERTREALAVVKTNGNPARAAVGARVQEPGQRWGVIGVNRRIRPGCRSRTYRPRGSRSDGRPIPLSHLTADRRRS